MSRLSMVLSRLNIPKTDPPSGLEEGISELTLRRWLIGGGTPSDRSRLVHRVNRLRAVLLAALIGCGLLSPAGAQTRER